MTENKIERTLVIIKPDAIEKRLVGKIIARIEDLGLTISQVRWKKLSPGECRKLYPKTRRNLPDIYAAVEKHMTENFNIILIAEGRNAAQKVQAIKGPVNLPQAPTGTIRRDFITDDERESFRQGKCVFKNLMHASDSKKVAEFEIRLLFNKKGKRRKLNILRPLFYFKIAAI